MRSLSCYRQAAVLFFLATLWSCAGAVGRQSATGPPGIIFGLYNNGQDSVRVTPAEKGGVSVVLQLYYASGNTCGLEKEGAWEHDHVSIVAEALEANQQCKLQLFFPKGHVLLKDEGGRCTQVYCGAHGQLDGVKLPKSRALPK